MEWKNLLLDGYGRIPQELEELLKGLPAATLDWQADPECNSIGWTVWHLARVQDAQIADLIGAEQLYLKESWYLKFERPADPKDTGFGDTPQDVARFKSPDAEVLLGYIKSATVQVSTLHRFTFSGRPGPGIK